MALAAIARMSYAEYIAFEEASETKHDFINGEVFPTGDPAVAMAGASYTHNRLVVRVSTALSNALEDRDCDVLASDMRVRASLSQFAAYPDISVVCNTIETAIGDPNAVINPTIIVEVLSDSTESYDRGAKFEFYRGIPTLCEYVLVSQHEPMIEVHRRDEHGRWAPAVIARAGQRAELVSCGAPIVLDVDAIYRIKLAT
jgi:Uma2 family endonuclease